MQIAIRLALSKFSYLPVGAIAINTIKINNSHSAAACI